MRIVNTSVCARAQYVRTQARVRRQRDALARGLHEMTGAAANVFWAGNTRSRVFASNRAARRRARQRDRRRSGCSRVPASTTDGYDSRQGLLFLNNRYHDPALGVFLSVDPLVVSTGEAYIYASGNPVTLSDPTGLATCMNAGGVVTGYNKSDCTGSDQEYASHLGEDLWDECRARCDEWRDPNWMDNFLPYDDDPGVNEVGFIRDVLEGMTTFESQGGGTCVSAGGTLGLTITGSYCDVSFDDSDVRGILLSLGIGVATPNLAASLTGGKIVHNATELNALGGPGGCFGVSSGEGVVASGVVCGGIEDGQFTGTIVAYLGAGVGAGLVPVDASVTITNTWTQLVTERINPRTTNPSYVVTPEMCGPCGGLWSG